MYYLNSRYYDPETGRFVNADDISFLDPETITGLNLYAYCGDNSVLFIDPDGHAILSILAAIAIAFFVGGTIGAAGTFLGDVVTSAITGNWEWSSWETYVGNIIGGGIGGALSLIPGSGVYIGAISSGTLGTFFGTTLEKITGTNDRSWTEIILETAFSLAISSLTAGMTKYLKIPGITQGSHSWQQIFKSGFTKAIKYGFNMSVKTLAKGAVYMLVSNFTTGFFANVIIQNIIKNIIDRFIKYYK